MARRVDALAATFTGLQSQHEAQKASLEGLTAQVEERKGAVTALQDQQRSTQNELAEVRKTAQAARGRHAVRRRS